MTRRVLVIAFVGFVLASAFVAFNFWRPEPQTADRKSAAPVERSAPLPAQKEGRTPEATPSEPAPRIARREGARPTPKVKPEREPAESARESATLRIDSDVPGAQVFIDRVFIGAAPVTAARVAPGTHRLNVSAPGYDGVAETLDVVPGPRDILIKLKEIRLDAKIAVVHKHRIGSCQGQLIATPRGLRYETTNKDDQFNVPLADLEVFQVDYLDKNLRLKLPRGSGTTSPILPATPTGSSCSIETSRRLAID